MLECITSDRFPSNLGHKLICSINLLLLLLNKIFRNPFLRLMLNPDYHGQDFDDLIGNSDIGWFGN